MEIYINGHQLDGYTGDPVAVTFELADFGQFVKPKGGYSNQFRVLATNVNRGIFDFADTVAVNSSNAYKLAEAEVREDGLPLFYGKAILEEAGENFVITILQGNSEYFSLINNLNLHDLEISSIWAGDFTQAHVAGRRLQNTGLFYPSAEIGQTLTKALQDLPSEGLTDVALQETEDWRPAIQIKPIIQAIENSIGWNFSGLEDFDDYEELCFPFTKGEFTRNDSYIKNRRIRVRFSNNFAAGSSEPWEVGNSGTIGSAFSYSAGDAFASFLNSGEGNRNVRWKITARVRVDGAVGINPSFPIRFTCHTSDSSRDIGKIKGDGIFEFETDSNQWRTDADKIYFPEFLVPSGSANIIAADSYFEISPWPVVETDISTANNYFEAADCIKNLKASELLNFLAFRYALLFSPDSVGKTINCISIKEVINRKNDPLDWSGKIDLSQTPPVSLTLKNYGQVNTITRPEGSEAETENNRRGVFEIDSELLPKEEEIYSCPFQLFGVVDSFNGERVLPKILLYPDPNEEPEEIPPIICRARLSDENLVLAPFQYPSLYANYDQAAVLSVSGLTFDEILAEYWDEFIDVIQEIKVVQADFVLTTEDILNLDLTRPIYVSHFGAVFIIQKVNQYKFGSRESTRLTLLKI
ncbi:hypothetical protein [Croceimicrobium sp.]|uniref:hypothetical protein n=1 Tax=Croceimicrobium sp. TaxID=2828340 RepID=UPI003BAD9781